MTIPYAIINRQRVMCLFHELMQPDSEFRILRLLGEGKLGKSHFMTKVFPVVARQVYRARCAVVDLRGQAHAVDILHAACSQLGGARDFQAYHAAYREWMNRPQVQVSGLQALLSIVRIRTEDEASERRRVTRHLVSQFVADLHSLAGMPVLLLLDSLDRAEEGVRSWLMDTLLVQLAPLTQVRAVVAGRSVPEACGSYVVHCRSYELLPVEEEEEYIIYCRQIGAALSEQSIRDFAYACNYKPGFFVDLVEPKFAGRGVANE